VPANHVRAENCYVEPQQPAWGGVDLATGGIGEKMVRTEDGVAAVRDYMFGSQLTSSDGASASGAMPLLGSISAKRVQVYCHFPGISIVPRSRTANDGRRNHLGRPSLANQVWQRGLRRQCNGCVDGEHSKAMLVPYDAQLEPRRHVELPFFHIASEDSSAPAEERSAQSVPPAPEDARRDQRRTSRPAWRSL
jgi:hypothetical protein